MSTRPLAAISILVALAACDGSKEAPRDALLRLARERGIVVGDPIAGQPGIRGVEVPASTGVVKGRWAMAKALARIRGGRSTPEEEIERLVAACGSGAAFWDTVAAAIYPRLRTLVWIADQDRRSEAQDLRDRVARSPAGADLLMTVGVALGWSGIRIGPENEGFRRPDGAQRKRAPGTAG